MLESDPTVNYITQFLAKITSLSTGKSLFRCFWWTRLSMSSRTSPVLFSSFEGYKCQVVCRTNILWSFWRDLISKSEVMKEREQIYQKFLRVGHFIFDILEKPDSFSRQNLYSENERSPKFNLFFENQKTVAKR